MDETTTGIEISEVDYWPDLLLFLYLLFQNIGNQPQGWDLQQTSEKRGQIVASQKQQEITREEY